MIEQIGRIITIYFADRKHNNCNTFENVNKSIYRVSLSN